MVLFQIHVTGGTCIFLQGLFFEGHCHAFFGKGDFAVLQGSGNGLALCCQLDIAAAFFPCAFHVQAQVPG